MKPQAYSINSAAYLEGKHSKSLTRHFSAASATTTLQNHIGCMGGEHWSVYLKQCVLLNIVPDERATPKAVLEEQKEKFGPQFVFELQYICSPIIYELLQMQPAMHHKLLWPS